MEAPLDAVPTTETLSPIAELVKEPVISLKEIRAAEADPATPKPADDGKPAETPEPVEEPPSLEDRDLTAADASEAGKQLAKKKGSLHERIGALTAQLSNKDQHISTLHAKLAELDTLKQRLAAIEAPKSEASGQPVPSAKQRKTIQAAEALFGPQSGWTRPLPSEDDIGTIYDAYNDMTFDQTVWFDEQRVAQANRQQEHKTRAEREASLNAQIVIARQQYPDWEATLAAGSEALAAAGIYQLPDVMHEAIAGSEHAVDLLRYVSTHPDEVIQLARDAHGLPPSAAGVVRRYLESRLPSAVSGPDAQPKPVTKAAAPIKPVGSASTATPSVATLVSGPVINLKRLRELEGRR